MELLNRFAEDNNGKIIHISKALSGTDYYCPECKEKFILKKGDIRQHHFTHNHASANCSGEGYLHKTFKKMLFEKIRNCINEKRPMNIIWKCNFCHTILPVNLLTKNCDVKDEYDMKVCKPDIALLNNKGDVDVVFEIIVTHKPEDNVLNYYKEKSIILIQIELNSENDLENIDETLEKHSIIKFPPDLSNFCINPNCISRRNNYRIRRRGKSRRF